MSKQETYINYIKELLRKGVVQRKNALAKFSTKWQIGERTFDRYWKEANLEYVDEAKTIENKKAKLNIAAEEEAAERDILNKLDMQEIATKIAKSDQELSKDRLKALEFLARVEGLFAPTKISQTDNEGNNVEPSATIMELAALLKSKK